MKTNGKISFHMQFLSSLRSFAASSSAGFAFPRKKQFTWPQKNTRSTKKQGHALVAEPIPRHGTGRNFLPHGVFEFFAILRGQFNCWICLRPEEAVHLAAKEHKEHKETGACSGCRTDPPADALSVFSDAATPRLSGSCPRITRIKSGSEAPNGA